jgi:hypothetical protein
MALQSGRDPDTLECALSWDKELKANAWCNFKVDRVGVISCGEISMWRLDAVEWNTGSQFRAQRILRR